MVVSIAMWFVTSCCVTRTMMTPVWTINIGRQSYSYLSVGCFTAIGTDTLATPACREH